MDVHLSAAPSLNCEDHTALYWYLWDVSVDQKFVTSVLQVIVKEYRAAHCTRWNNQRAAKSFKIDDVVEAQEWGSRVHTLKRLLLIKILNVNFIIMFTVRVGAQI